MDTDLVLFIAVATSIASTVGLYLFGVVDWRQLKSIRKIDNRLDAEAKVFEERGKVGEQIGEWMLESEGEGKPTNLQIMASQVGQVIASSFKMGIQGIASGEARLVRGVETKLMEHFEEPEAKALLKICDEAGINREYAGVVYNVLKERGWIDKILQNNGGGSSSGGNNGTWGR